MIKVQENFYQEDNDYNREIYAEYKDDIKKYFDKYKKEDYSKIIKEDKRTNIVSIFSEMRGNIVKWYPFDKTKKVLEIGANYGEITQTLLKKCNSVTSIEFSKEKIECIQKRLEDTENLNLILCTYLNKLELEDKYDYITLIGTSEYAKKLGFNSLNEMIQWANKYLAEDGKIILAIDNKFGAKYLAGSTRNKDEKTFASYNINTNKEYEIYGKIELEKIIKQSGFNNYKFYYPLPDYNLTHLIYTDNYLPKQSKYDIYYKEHEEILFNELLLMNEAIKNEKFDFFANSYLIEIARKEESLSNIYFVNYSNMRKKEYKIVTKLSPEQVLKEPYNQQGKNHINKIEENIKILEKLGVNICEKKQDEKIISKYCNLPTMNEYLQKMTKEEKTELYQELDKWYEFIKSKFQETEDKETIFEKYKIEITEEQKDKLTFLKDGFIDFIFQNVFYDGNEYIVFDQEWYEKNVPLEFIMYRAIKQLTFLNKENLQEIYIKYNINKYINIFEKLETKWQESIVDKEILSFYSEKWNRIISIEDIKFKHNQELGKVYLEKDKLQEKISELQKEIDKSKNELLEIKNSSRFYKWMKFFDRRK